jgi:hypothetical protein
VATYLQSKPGLTGATALSIPATWDATWFRNFINNMLKGGDVRNAIGANGITVSGTIASPYATIGFGAPVTLPGPVTISIPSSGTTPTLTVFGSNSIPALELISATAGQASYMEFAANGTQQAFIGVAGAAGQISAGTSTNDLVLRSQSANIDFTANSAVSVQMQLTAAGNFTINAPSSGTALTAYGVAGSPTAIIKGSSTSGQSYGLQVLAGTTSADQVAGFYNQAGTTLWVSISGSGALSVAGAAAFNGATPQGKVTGYGTPTGGTITANFPGATATLLQTSGAVAELISILKNWGILGA